MLEKPVQVKRCANIPFKHAAVIATSTIGRNLLNGQFDCVTVRTWPSRPHLPAFRSMWRVPRALISRKVLASLTQRNPLWSLLNK